MILHPGTHFGNLHSWNINTIPRVTPSTGCIQPRRIQLGGSPLVNDFTSSPPLRLHHVCSWMRLPTERIRERGRRVGRNIPEGLNWSAPSPWYEKQRQQRGSWNSRSWNSRINITELYPTSLPLPTHLLFVCTSQGNLFYLAMFEHPVILNEDIVIPLR